MHKELVDFLEHKAFNLRRLSIISTTQAGSGHPTSALSAADIVSVLFFDTMNYDPSNPDNTNNDRFILSKGHAAPILYAAWQQVGVLKEKDLLTLRQMNSILEGHPTRRFNRVEAATGSLGQGLSIGAGIALSSKLDRREFYTYVLMGDSEISEGQIWEAAQIASFYNLNNLVAILDCNGLGQTAQTMDSIDTYAKKFEAFGWHVSIINGHDIPEIARALQDSKKNKTKPSIIIAKTIKGYGIASIEGKNGYHGKVFTKEELSSILDELNKRFYKAYQYDGHYKWEPKVPKYEEESKVNKFNLPKSNYAIGSMVATRHVYGEALANLSKVCPELLSLDAEVKNSTFAEILENEDPKKFIQCFIAEQNMISMAVGLYSRGKIPFASTFASFLTRAFDQLRMAAIDRAALRICGSHAGVSIGQDGPSQMGLEDVAMFAALPNSIILYPCDAVSCYYAVELMANYKEGISYLRTTRSQTPVIYSNDQKFQIGKCSVLKQSNKDIACIIAAGITLHEAIKAYDQLKCEGINISIIDLYSIKPFDVDTVIEVARKSNNRIITVEDHYLQGGIGQIVSYELRNHNFNITTLAVSKLSMSGTPDELLAYEGIDYKSIVQKVKNVI